MYNMVPFKCVNEGPKSTGIWTCFNCRIMPEIITDLRQERSNINKRKTLILWQLLEDMKRQRSFLVSEQTVNEHMSNDYELGNSWNMDMIVVGDFNEL